MNGRLRLVAIGMAAAALAACAAPTGGTGEGEDAAALAVDVHDATSISGTFAHAGSLVSFESLVVGEQQVRLHVDVNGQPIDATADYGNQTLWWTGHDGALYAEDTAALGALLDAFAEYFGSDEGLLPHEDFLVRRVSYWSEAPAGLTLPERNVTTDVVPDGLVRMPPADAVYGEEEATAVGPTAGGEVSYQGKDEDGIWYIRCNRYSYAVHDSNSHCKSWESVYGGPNSSNCHGKCGGGCGFGTAGYTYDCHDHDRCGRVHGGSTNPWDAECGDEYFEADDDFLWSIIGKCV